MITMYKATKSGKFNTLTISITDDGKWLSWSTGLEGGARNGNSRRIFIVGNNRTLAEQGDIDLKSKIHAFTKKGYRPTKHEAKSSQFENILGQPVPMKAFDGRKVDSIGVPFYSQPKLNGIRCMIFRDGSVVKAYTYGGRWVETCSHILDNVAIPEGVYLDGEIYHHGTPLQTINSWVKRKQPDTLKLKFFLFDVYTPSRPDMDMVDRITWVASHICFDNMEKVPTRHHQAFDDLRVIRDEYMKDGYEGAIFRECQGFYEPKGRPQTMVKMKKAMDGEYMINNVTASREGWGVVHCVTDDGYQFTCSAPGTHEEKVKFLEDKVKHIGCWLKVEYFEKTIAGCPSQPIAICVRDIG